MSRDNERCNDLERDLELPIDGVLEVDTSEEDLNIIRINLNAFNYKIVKEFQDKEKKISHLYYERSSKYENA